MTAAKKKTTPRTPDGPFGLVPVHSGYVLIHRGGFRVGQLERFPDTEDTDGRTMGYFWKIGITISGDGREIEAFFDTRAEAEAFTLGVVRTLDWL